MSAPTCEQLRARLIKLLNTTRADDGNHVDEINALADQADQVDREPLFELPPDGDKFPVVVNATPQCPIPDQIVNQWLCQPNPAFGGDCPRKYLEGSDRERRFFESVISAIEEGAFS